MKVFLSVIASFLLITFGAIVFNNYSVLGGIVLLFLAYVVFRFGVVAD